MCRIAVLLSILLTLSIACIRENKKSQEEVAAKPTVVAVNYPLHYFVQRIAGDLIEMNYPIPPDVDPAYWEPDAESIQIYQEADLIIANGAKYAKWMEKVSLPSSKIVNSSKSFQDKYIETQEGVTHSHGPQGEHAHLGFAFTTWLNFKFAALQAEAVKNALIKLLPDSDEVLEANYDSLKKDLDYLDQRMTEIASSLQNTTLFASHPVYQYLADGYGLKIISEHWEPDEMPTQDQWQIFRDKIARDSGEIMLAEDELLDSVRQQLASLGIKAVVFNPCSNWPEEGDFLSMMKGNVIRGKIMLLRLSL